MPNLILDLDHTLLNTTKFKLALADSLDLSVEAWDQAYAGFVNDNGLFRPDDFLKGVTSTQREAFDTVVNTLRKFLYPDVMSFLQTTQQLGYAITILTFGDKLWQEQKLAGLKLPATIQTIATHQPKVKALAELVTTDTIVVDDRATELEAMAAMYPELKLYWITRPEGKYLEPIPQCSHHQIQSLTEITL